jgi:hypothetical protein
MPIERSGRFDSTEAGLKQWQFRVDGRRVIVQAGPAHPALISL